MKNQPACNPVGYFKNRKSQTCLAIRTKETNKIKVSEVFHKTCDGYEIENWTWIDGVHICNNQQKNCLAVSSKSNWNIDIFYRNPEDLFLELIDYNNSKVKGQQWKLDKSTGVISVFARSLSVCLTDNPRSALRFPNSVETPVIIDYNIMGESNCISWDFIPIRNPGSQQICD